MMHVSQARLHSSRTIGVGTIGGSADYGALFQVGILMLLFCCNAASETYLVPDLLKQAYG